jgi:hypothetical protein
MGGLHTSSGDFPRRRRDAAVVVPVIVLPRRLVKAHERKLKKLDIGEIERAYNG